MTNNEKLIREKLQEARRDGVAEDRDPYIMFGRVELFRLRASREQFAELKESRPEE
jgi:hypothetical protein